MQALVKIIMPGAGIAEKANLVEEIPDPIAETHMSIILEHVFCSQAGKCCIAALDALFEDVIAPVWELFEEIRGMPPELFMLQELEHLG